MADCRHVAAFLQGVSTRSVQSALTDADLAPLRQAGLIDLLSPQELDELKLEVGQLEAAQRAIQEEEARQQQAAEAVATDTRRTHSILFHIQGVDKEEATVDRLHEEQAALQAIEADLAKREADFAQLLVKKSELDLMSPYDGHFIAITTAGRVALRDLTAALYRVGDQEFASYWTQAKAIDGELSAIVAQAAAIHASLAQALPGVDPSYLWAVAIGMAKRKGTPDQQVPAFLDAYRAVGSLTTNVENRLLASEVLSGIGQPVAGSLPELTNLAKEVEALGVHPDGAAGVAAILLSGRRADGTYATDPFGQFLRLTPSYEAAALLAVVNKPFNDLAGSFGNLRKLFASWGYSVSEDSELSSAYLAPSELPVDTIATKMAILSRGVGAYMEYPLVAAAILASIPVLEANETLNLLEKAYEILGGYTGPMTQAELLSLAVRTIHGVDVRSVSELDPTQARPASYPSFSYYGVSPGLWIPVFVVHGAYYSTFSAIGGMHPGHVHAVGGGGWGGGFGGGFGG
jgi:hypothetical protein